MEYHEQERYGNGYRRTYQDGLASLLDNIRRNSELERDNWADEIRNRPEQFRDRVRKTLGWPLTERNRKDCRCKMCYVAKDEYGEIYRVQLEIQPQLWMYGILFIKDTKTPRPLVIAQHGGLGTPEMCSGFFDSENYNDMTRRILKKDVNVFCPQLFLWDPKRFGAWGIERNSYNNALRPFGSSIAAVELDGLMKYVDWLSSQAYVDPNRIGMIGLSYGGFYTLYMTALDQRIKSALCSCYFNNKLRYNSTDWTWDGSSNLFGDAEIAALIAPRKLWIQVGDNDELFSVYGAKKEYSRLQKLYEPHENLVFEIFPGVHEFGKTNEGIDYVVQALTV